MTEKNTPRKLFICVHGVTVSLMIFSTSVPKLSEGIWASPAFPSLPILVQEKRKGDTFILLTQQYDFIFKCSLCAKLLVAFWLLYYVFLCPFLLQFTPPKLLPSCLRLSKTCSAKRTFAWSRFCPNYKPKCRVVTYSIPFLATRFHKCWQARSYDK